MVGWFWFNACNSVTNIGNNIAECTCSLIFAETLKEVCSKEDLNIRCSYNEVIAMTSAFYGHIHQCKCIPRDLGHFGCLANVLHYLDEKCSNKRNCVLSMTDTGLTDLEPECALGLGIFLEIKHICIKGKCDFDFFLLSLFINRTY